MNRASTQRTWTILLALWLGACAGSEGQRKVQEANQLLTTDQIDEALSTYRAAQKIEPDLGRWPLPRRPRRK